MRPPFLRSRVRRIITVERCFGHTRAGSRSEGRADAISGAAPHGRRRPPVFESDSPP